MVVEEEQEEEEDEEDDDDVVNEGWMNSVIWIENMASRWID